jgi:outer membrane protein OmpA-like peptidoglycan-associated protein
METNYPGSFIQKPFRLNIEVTDIQEPQGEVTVGPISVLRTHEVLFERPGQGKVSSTQEGQLIRWYNSLSEAAKEQIQSGAEPMSLEGHASTTGNPARNRELSNQRMEEARRILGQYAGSQAIFHSRSVGEYQSSTDDNVESAEERKVVISVLEQAENPAGTIPGSAP